LLALERGQSDAAGQLLAQARTVVGDEVLDAYPPAAILLAAMAREAILQLDNARALDLLARAQRLHARLTDTIPWLSAQTQLELARAHAALADTETAAELVAGARAVLARRRDLGVLRCWADEVDQILSGFRNSANGWASTITAAELRLLPLLTTHMTFREIGERLFVSRNTIKTQAISIYRKLGVSSRNEAIERAVELGLVDRGTLTAAP
jgi:LuxR family maltose regulon positive regulatory protein